LTKGRWLQRERKAFSWGRFRIANSQFCTYCCQQLTTT
jgi:hypothetical protein